MLYILRDVIWHKWRKYVSVFITLATVYSWIGESFYPNLGLLTMRDLLTLWEWWLWLTMGLVLLVIATFAIANQQRRELKVNDNWIVAHKAKTGKFPVIPSSLLTLVDKYTTGKPISKDIKLKERPSHQAWGRLTPENKERFLQIMDWLGLDRYDFIQNIEDSRPPGGSKMQLKRKR